MKALVITALLALAPSVASAETAPVMYVPRYDRFIPHLYVHKGSTLDVALPEHWNVTSNPIVGDPRWIIATFGSGDTSHVLIKPSDTLGEQLLTIPTSSKTLHLVVSSGDAESTAYTLDFYEPQRVQARGTAAAARPRPTVPPKPRAVTVADCAAPLDSKYRWAGDRRIDVVHACDNGRQTFIVLRDGRNTIGAVPYRVDVGGRQDQIANATFAPATSSRPGQWVIDGLADRWALVADSSRGQIRTTIVHGQ